MELQPCTLHHPYYRHFLALGLVLGLGFVMKVAILAILLALNI